MTISTESFLELLQAARVGVYQLPEFQRQYVWKRRQVIDLFDSLRQRYPIGAILVMERNPNIQIAPRPFEGTAPSIEPDVFVLDGQQRLTSGLALYYGLGTSHYFINLDRLWVMAQKVSLNVQDETAVRYFLDDIDPDDGYCIGRMKSADPMKLLDSHLLYTAVLSDSTQTRNALRAYSTKFPERTDFVDIVIRDHFRLTDDVQVPVTRVEKNRPVEAVSRIFATLNTTGSPLNSFELVVAILYPSGIRLRSDIAENAGKYRYYKNMDSTGEVFLQTIAMLAGQSPKKAQLPKTITPDRYRLYRAEAVEALEQLGAFLTLRLGVGLDQSAALIPYDSIFPPMALALRHLRSKNLAGAELSKAERKLEKWFVVAALDQHYQEGVHNKQAKDLGEMVAWLDSDEPEREPEWMRIFRVPRLLPAGPDGAVGRLLRCMINARTPRDPVSNQIVGEHPGAVVSSKHHIFPTRWVDKYLAGWNPSDTANVALNITVVSHDTNVKWLNADPANQIHEIEGASATLAAAHSRLEAHFLDKACIEILKRPEKSKADYQEFLAARERLFLKEVADKWGVTSNSEIEVEDEGGGGAVNEERAEYVA